VKRHRFLRELHRLVQPRTYLETGIQRGASLALSRVPSIGIDPEFSVEHELATDVHLVRSGSDEFFARPDPLAHLPVPVVDLAFIDGMHLAEYALRDILAVERFTTAGSVILVDDALPRDVATTRRLRIGRERWTGDVYKVIGALRTLRPDLVVIEVDTSGTGTLLVMCPDAARNGVLEGYDDWLESVVVPDPQEVPESVLRRTRAVDPVALVESPGWASVVRARGLPYAEAAPLVRAAFADFAAGPTA
jgi:hypothetical protein